MWYATGKKKQLVPRDNVWSARVGGRGTTVRGRGDVGAKEWTRGVSICQSRFHLNICSVSSSSCKFAICTDCLQANQCCRRKSLIRGYFSIFKLRPSPPMFSFRILNYTPKGNLGTSFAYSIIKVYFDFIHLLLGNVFAKRCIGNSVNTYSYCVNIAFKIYESKSFKILINHCVCLKRNSTTVSCDNLLKACTLLSPSSTILKAGLIYFIWPSRVLCKNYSTNSLLSCVRSETNKLQSFKTEPIQWH